MNDGVFRIILLVPQNIVMDVNNVINIVDFRIGIELQNQEGQSEYSLPLDNHVRLPRLFNMGFMMNIVFCKHGPNSLWATLVVD